MGKGNIIGNGIFISQGDIKNWKMNLLHCCKVFSTILAPSILIHSKKYTLKLSMNFYAFLAWSLN
jgi:hypothetical protein